MNALRTAVGIVRGSAMDQTRLVMGCNICMNAWSAGAVSGREVSCSCPRPYQRWMGAPTIASTGLEVDMAVAMPMIMLAAPGPTDEQHTPTWPLTRA